MKIRPYFSVILIVILAACTPVTDQKDQSILRIHFIDELTNEPVKLNGYVQITWREGRDHWENIWNCFNELSEETIEHYKGHPGLEKAKKCTSINQSINDPIMQFNLPQGYYRFRIRVDPEYEMKYGITKEGFLYIGKSEKNVYFYFSEVGREYLGKKYPTESLCLNQCKQINEFKEIMQRDYDLTDYTIQCLDCENLKYRGAFYKGRLLIDNSFADVSKKSSSPTSGGAGSSFHRQCLSTPNNNLFNDLKQKYCAAQSLDNCEEFVSIFDNIQTISVSNDKKGYERCFEEHKYFGF